jgi:serine/threonine-protein phosphatase PGAM5
MHQLKQGLKYTLAAVAASGVTHQYLTFDPERKLKKLETPQKQVFTNYEDVNKITENHKTYINRFNQPIQKWDYNWDHRHSDDKEHPDSEYVDIKMPKKNATRYIYLIRHGQYHTSEKNAEDKKLTELGHEQARFTGIRLAQIFNLEKEKAQRAHNKKYEKQLEDGTINSKDEIPEFKFPKINIIQSSMIRAIETANEIKDIFDSPKAKVDWNFAGQSELIAEGACYPSEPPISEWCEEYEYYKDSSRIEAGFREFIHRADPDQEGESHDVIVCHANVIRYYVCRALQIPPEAWLRISLQHGSITKLVCRPSGRVSIHVLGDHGFMPIDKVSVR